MPNFKLYFALRHDKHDYVLMGKFCNFRILLTTKCTQSNTFLDLLVNLCHTGYIAWMIWREMPLLVTRRSVHCRWNDLVLTSDREREAHWGPIRSLTPTLSERSVSEMDGDRNGPKTVLPSKMIVADHDRTGKWACDLAPPYAKTHRHTLIPRVIHKRTPSSKCSCSQLHTPH